VSALASKEGWDKVLPEAIQKFTTTNGKWDAIPINIHSANWIWLNKALFEKHSSGSHTSEANWRSQAPTPMLYGRSAT
jgi:glucose/mannose transport system substrate-binding protein